MLNHGTDKSLASSASLMGTSTRMVKLSYSTFPSTGGVRRAGSKVGGRLGMENETTCLAMIAAWVGNGCA